MWFKCMLIHSRGIMVYHRHMLQQVSSLCPVVHLLRHLAVPLSQLWHVVEYRPLRRIRNGKRLLLLKFKKKWFDMKLDTKRCLSKSRRSVTATGGGQEDMHVRRTDERIQTLLNNICFRSSISFNRKLISELV